MLSGKIKSICGGGSSDSVDVRVTGNTNITQVGERLLQTYRVLKQLTIVNIVAKISNI
jgi:hypothetical protein